MSSRGTKKTVEIRRAIGERNETWKKEGQSHSGEAKTHMGNILGGVLYNGAKSHKEMQRGRPRKTLEQETTGEWGTGTNIQ